MTYDIVPIQEEHITGFHRVMDFVAKERKYLVFTEAPPIEKTQVFVRGLIAAGTPAFVALHKGEVIGWCDIQKMQRPMHAHRGTLAMGLLPEFRGQGIGKKLMQEALDAGFSLGLTRIELTVKESNLPAIKLYEGFGFEMEGLHKNANCIDGQYSHSYTMALVKV